MSKIGLVFGLFIIISSIILDEVLKSLIYANRPPMKTGPIIAATIFLTVGVPIGIFIVVYSFYNIIKTKRTKEDKLWNG